MSNNSDDIQAAGSDTRPPMLDRTDYESWSQRIRLYYRGKENGLQILQSIDQGPFKLGTTKDALGTTPEGGVLLGPERPRTYKDLSDTEKKIATSLLGVVQDQQRILILDLEEFCEKHYKKLLPIMADKYEYERRKKEKLEEVKARLDFGEAQKKSTRAQESAYSESRTMSPRRQRRSHSPRHSPSVFTRLRRERSRSPRHDHKSKARRESTVFKRLGSRGRSAFAHSDSRQESSRDTENHSESDDSEGGHWKSKSRRQKYSVEDDDLSQPW
ncbi:hypothetical protein Tco_1288691, partial [Tanacetum coccineum]